MSKRGIFDAEKIDFVAVRKSHFACEKRFFECQKKVSQTNAIYGSSGANELCVWHMSHTRPTADLRTAHNNWRTIRLASGKTMWVRSNITACDQMKSNSCFSVRNSINSLSHCFILFSFIHLSIACCSHSRRSSNESRNARKHTHASLRDSHSVVVTNGKIPINVRTWCRRFSVWNRRLRYTKWNECMYLIILFATQPAVDGIRMEYCHVITFRFIFFSLEYDCLLVCFHSFVLLRCSVHEHTHTRECNVPRWIRIWVCLH